MDRLQIVVSPFARVVVDEHCPEDMAVLVPTLGNRIAVFRGGKCFYVTKDRMQEIYDNAVRTFFGKEWTE